MQTYSCKEQYIDYHYNYRFEIEQQITKSLPQDLLVGSQLQKIIRTVSAIFKLNLLQCSMLSWLLKRSKPCNKEITTYSKSIRLFQESCNQQLFLFMLLNAYYVKSFINKDDIVSLDGQILAIVPQFNQIYKKWRPDDSLQNVSLFDLNFTFKNWAIAPHNSRLDYNNFVDKILQLSKTYNVGGHQQEIPRKRRKIQQIDEVQIKENNLMVNYMMQADEIDQEHSPDEVEDMLNNNIWHPSEQNCKDLLKKSGQDVGEAFSNFHDIGESGLLFGNCKTIMGNMSFDKQVSPVKQISNQTQKTIAGIKPTISYSQMI